MCTTPLPRLPHTPHNYISHHLSLLLLVGFPPRHHTCHHVTRRVLPVFTVLKRVPAPALSLSLFMDRLTPNPSFRPSRPTTRTRTRSRPMSPSPRPNHRRPFTDAIPSTMFITTDYDYNCISPSSPDQDLIFSMSPIQSHILSSSPPPREPVNVMSLRNKPNKKNSPPLSPLLYSFPRPSRLHSYIKQTPAPNTLTSKPLTRISQNKTLVSSRSSRTALRVDDRPLTASLIDSFSTQTQKQCESDVVSSPPRPTSTRSPHDSDSHPSSPIPIPKHKPRQADPGPFVAHPISPHPLDGTPLPSSGIASHVGRHSGNPPPSSGSSASLEPLHRIEGFDESACDSLVIDDDKSSYPDFYSSIVSSTAYSISDSTAPFRFSRYLDPEPIMDQGLDKSDGGGRFLMHQTARGHRG